MSSAVAVGVCGALLKSTKELLVLEPSGIACWNGCLEAGSNGGDADGIRALVIKRSRK